MRYAKIKQTNHTFSNSMRGHYYSTIFLQILTLILALFSEKGVAGDQTAQEQALKMIVDTADNICKEVSDKTSKSSIELSGEAKAELNGLIGKVVDLGLKGAGKYVLEESQGPLQSEIATLITNNQNCRKDIFDKLVDKFIQGAIDDIEYLVVIKQGTYPIYNYRQFGRVDGDRSLVELKIDDKSITRRRLSDSFGSYALNLRKGDHIFSFVAKVRGKGNNYASIDSSCGDKFSVFHSGSYEPRLKFESFGAKGDITSCSLEPVD